METNQILENNPLLLNSKSIVGRLILTLNDMAKKPKIEDDLSGALDTFMEKLNESEKYLSNGIVNTNFAEAALLLQSSVELYGKKIDLLWDSIISYQKHIVTYEKDSINRAKEVELINDRQNRFKRKRKIQETGLIKEQTSISELMNTAKEIDSTSMEPCEVLHNNWEACINKEKDNECSKNSILSTHCLHMIDVTIYDTDEMLITTGRITLYKILYDLRKDFCVFRRFCLKKNCRFMTHFYEHDQVLQKYLKEKQVSVDEVEKLYRDAYKTFLMDYLREKELATRNISARLAEKCAALCPKHVVARVQRLSQDVILQYLKKDLSQEKIKRANSTVPNICESEKEVFNDTENTTLADSGLGDDLDISMANSDSINTSKITSNSDLEKTVIAQEKSKSTRFGDLNLKNCTVVLQKLPKKLCHQEIFEEEPPKQKRRKSSMKVKPIIKMTVPMKQFEKFFSKHYKPEKEEGQVTEVYSDSEDENEVDTSDSQLNCTATGDKTQSFVTDSGIDPVVVGDSSEVDEQNNSLSISSEVAKENISVCRETQSAADAAGQSILQQIKENEESQRRVTEWKTFITNKLNQMGQHSDFDIHAYGTKIIDSFEIEKSKKFKDLVGGKNAGEVSRYFLATLQLANTYNVEIIQPAEGTTASDTLQLKLLSKERYHESLENYMAPSEETFQERLAKVQALNPKVPLSSTPNKSKIQRPKVMKLSNKSSCSSVAPSTSQTRVHHRNEDFTSR